jgi:Ni,Fe-hydrogenase III small subunit
MDVIARDGGVLRMVPGSGTTGSESGPLPLFVNMSSSPQKIHRVYGAPPEPNLVMQMGPRAPARGAHGSNSLANGDALAPADLYVAQMPITSLESMTVINLDHIAIAGLYASECNSSR